MGDDDDVAMMETDNPPKEEEEEADADAADAKANGILLSGADEPED